MPAVHGPEHYNIDTGIERARPCCNSTYDLSGVAGAIQVPAGCVLAVESCPVAARSRLMFGIQMLGCLGYLLDAIFVRVLMPHFGEEPSDRWRAFCLVIGGVALAVLPLAAMLHESPSFRRKFVSLILHNLEPRVPLRLERLKLFREFVAGPCGSPGGDREDPDRALASRRNPKINLGDHPCLLKALAFADNLDSIRLPQFLHKFNGKPVLISKSGYVVKAHTSEWLELGADVRHFSPMARDMLVRFRELIPKASLHFGFLIQGVADDELPEGLLGDVHVHYLSLLHGPRLIHDPRAECGGR